MLVAYRLEASTVAMRCAATPSSRSNRRYQGVEPRACDRLRNASSPASGFGESANHDNIAGSNWRWIDDRRETPSVSAWMCRTAALGSPNPRAVRRCSAASGLSRDSSPGIRATAANSGR